MFAKGVLCGLLGSAQAFAASSDPIVLGANTLLPRDPRQFYSRWTRFRPGEGEVVQLNPPRFSWPYVPDVVSEPPLVAGRRFTLEISAHADFKSLAVCVTNATVNFYNFLPPLPRNEGARWFWRVGYDVGTPEERWSGVRSFQIASKALEWDRSMFGTVLDGSPKPHPRILLDDVSLSRLRELIKTNPVVSGIFSLIQAQADSTLTKPWYLQFPNHDCPPGTPPTDPLCQLDDGGWLSIGQSLTALAFVHRVTGMPQYAGNKERFLKIAALPKGGQSTPRGSHPDSGKWATHLTEHLGLFYDWYHSELTVQERALVLSSLNWRIDDILNNFSWRDRLSEGPLLHDIGSLALIGWSHEYQSLFPTTIGALAIYDESPLAREALELGLHFIVGVSNTYGEDEAWNEGPGYGNDKMRNLLDATIALISSFPEFHLEKNPVLSAYADFFARVTPVGAEHSAFGNRGHHESDWTATRQENMYRVALLHQNGQAMQNWLATESRRQKFNRGPNFFSPWMTCVLPVWFQQPLPRAETNFVGLFPLEGWVTVSSAPPSDEAAQADGVSVTFHARPRGGYGHSFASDNAFDLHAYGETISVGGGTTDNMLNFPRHSMSQNTILVNGNPQARSDLEDYRADNQFGHRLDLASPIRARLIAFHQGRTANGVPYVYWAGDATHAYLPEVGLKRFIRHAVFVANQGLVLYDDLETMDPTVPASFQWLYHVVPATNVPITFDPAEFTFRYAVGGVSVVVRHLAETANLEFIDLLRDQGHVNIIHCLPSDANCPEDFRGESSPRVSPEEAIVDAHHIWVKTREPRARMHFLSAIVPFKTGMASPVIEPLGNSQRTVRINFGNDTISLGFTKSESADLLIDTDLIGVESGLPTRPVLEDIAWTTKGLSVSFATEPGHSYTLERTESLTEPAWVPLQSGFGDGARLTLKDTQPNASQRIYRVKVK
ncbi:MAG: DUF4962 domain-containing protein [Verrucomicrobiota bacterium]